MGPSDPCWSNMRWIAPSWPRIAIIGVDRRQPPPPDKIAMGELLLMAGKAFFIALILTPIIRDISRSFNVVDRPGQRKVHVHPVPRVGGVAIAMAYRSEEHTSELQ